MEWHNLVEDWVTAGRQLLVLHSEQVPALSLRRCLLIDSKVVKDPVASVKNILNFLKLPLDARRAACLPYIDFSMQKRRTSISKSPFSSQTTEKVMGKQYNFRAYKLKVIFSLPGIGGHENCWYSANLLQPPWTSLDLI